MERLWKSREKQLERVLLNANHIHGSIEGIAGDVINFNLIEDESVVLDSEVPSRAIVNVKKQWPLQAVAFAHQVQKARYWHGKDLNKVETYLDICKDLKLDQAQFLQEFHSDSLKKHTQENFLLAHNYASSYPSLLIQKSNKIFVVEQGYASFETIVNEINTLIY